MKYAKYMFYMLAQICIYMQISIYPYIQNMQKYAKLNMHKQKYEICTKICTICKKNANICKYMHLPHEFTSITYICKNMIKI